MDLFYSKKNKVAGSNYSEVLDNSKIIFKEIEGRSKRKPYLRSAFFNKEKIFLDYFWIHLRQKNPAQRFGRLKYFICAIDLIENSSIKPISKNNPNVSYEILHRFFGMTKERDLFIVQIKEDIKKDKKYFMSCFSNQQKNPPPKWSV